MQEVDLNYTFIATSNDSTNGVALGSSEQDIRVYKVIVGAPVDDGQIEIHSIENPVAGATGNMAARLTVANTGSENADQPLVFDLGGLPLGDGGNVVVDQNMDVTVVWGRTV